MENNQRITKDRILEIGYIYYDYLLHEEEDNVMFKWEKNDIVEFAKDNFSAFLESAEPHKFELNSEEIAILKQEYETVFELDDISEHDYYRDIIKEGNEQLEQYIQIKKEELGLD